MNKVCSCHTCSHLNKIDLLKKTSSSDELQDDTSPRPFNRLPDEVLIRILNFISPVNIDDFISLVALEMVSKRFRGFVADILGNITELVIGFHPELPTNQYLCHIGHLTLKLFLQRAKKISKVIVNINDDWLCSEMTEKVMLSSVIDRFGGQIELQHFILHKYRYMEDGSLVNNLIHNAQQFLQSAQISIWIHDFAPNITKIGPALAECSQLQNVKLTLEKWENSEEFANEDDDLIQLILLSQHFRDFPEFLSQLKSVEVLQLNGYIQKFIEVVAMAIARNQMLHLQVVRFTNPIVMHTHFLLNLFMLLMQTCIHELEIHCGYPEYIDLLPVLFYQVPIVSHPIHLKLTFYSFLKSNKVTKIAEMLEWKWHDRRMLMACKFQSLSNILI